MYTSNNHIERYLKRKNQNQEGSCVKRSKRSSTTFFDFKKDCLIYGEACNIEKDKKHPERWNENKSFLFRTANRGKGKHPLKKYFYRYVLLSLNLVLFGKLCSTTKQINKEIRINQFQSIY